MQTTALSLSCATALWQRSYPGVRAATRAAAGISCQPLAARGIGQRWAHMGVLMTGCGEKAVQVEEMAE